MYMVASAPKGTLYVGVTSQLLQRIWQHKQKAIAGFTKNYNVDMLVWFEMHATMEYAILCEKQIKEWRRAWKIALITAQNPQWNDLYDEICR